MADTEAAPPVEATQTDTPSTPPPTPAAPPPDDGKGPVPYHRFVDVIRERDDFRSRWEAASASDRALTEARAEAERARAELEAERLARTEDRAFYGAGLVDSDAQDVARLLYGKLADKPDGGLAAWLKATTENPDAAPVPLRPYIVKPPPGPAPAPARNVAPGAEQRSVSGDVSADQLRALREEAQRTGDWTAWRNASQAAAKRR